MLYKKYHRNFVKQFKKGSKFVYKSECVGGFKPWAYTVKRGPYYNGTFWKGICMHDDSECELSLVYSDGQLANEINAV